MRALGIAGIRLALYDGPIFSATTAAKRLRAGFELAENAVGTGRSLRHLTSSRLWSCNSLHRRCRFVEWVPDGQTRRKILVDNPARLYRF